MAAEATSASTPAAPAAPATPLPPAPDRPPRSRPDDKARSPDKDAPKDAPKVDDDDNGPLMTPQPPPTSTEPGSSVRPSRSESVVACRSANRLSLTLPIARPSSGPSRPAPTSAPPPVSSIPPTPAETPTVPPSAPDANEFIIAIAAQERRVLELREELARAEADLASLKRQWTARETHHPKGTSHHKDPLAKAAAPDAMDDAGMATRRSVELDRRKLLLQSHNQGTPTQGGRRRVMRGGHARALSLLSPAKSSSDFSIHEAIGQGLEERRPAQPANAALAKRASWQPRSAQSSPTVPQIVEDFKLGLRAFVDDIRQITVGDEPVRSHFPGRGLPGGAATRLSGEGADRPRAGPRPQPRASLGSDVSAAARLERPKPTKSKPFSWTPLGFDSMDDSDWSNWETPGPAKSPRWSDSTINSAGLEDIGSIPEAGEESITPIRTKLAKREMMSLPPKLEEILPNVVNRLSPTNLQRTANNLMDEWEKSLTAPEPPDKENEAVTA
ncbi:hypothetical protein CDD83_9195 [Cordyceps sp. RAO-2017]|nr:hypothetical protein CDD83_9195 [Cordyceps sp. RAO-2017]